MFAVGVRGCIGPARVSIRGFIAFRRLADEPPEGRLGVLRIVQPFTVGGVSAGERSCTESVGEHAE